MNSSQSECQCNVSLYDTEQNTIGDLNIMLNLEDHGPYYKVKRKATSKFISCISMYI